uniref:Uncharacterized protein n=1 Tax=Eptatretus burgeri TaxID=7764 RepID=A0A8C4Q9Q5_EPTBU
MLTQTGSFHLNTTQALISSRPGVMAVAERLRGYLRLAYYQEEAADEVSHQIARKCDSPTRPDDDVDLEALVNGMSAAFDGVRGLVESGLSGSPRPASPHVSSQSSSPHPIAPNNTLNQRFHCPSQPMHIKRVRRLLEDERQSSSLPARPSVLTSSCTSPLLDRGLPRPCPHSSVQGLLPTSSLETLQSPSSSSTVTKVIKIFGEDGSNRLLEIPADATVRDVTQQLVLRVNCVEDSSWGLIEHMPNVGIERTLEDHECAVQLQSAWGADGEGRLVFRKHYGKHEVFQHPEHHFLDGMVSDGSDANGCISHSELLQSFFMPSACPEVQGFLHVREPGKKTWKRSFFLLRRSGLYCSVKGSSKEPRHLQFFADLSEDNIYTVSSARKMFSAPTEYCICLKPMRSSSAKELKLLCAEDETRRRCWHTCMRLLKYGIQLYHNYHMPLLPRRNLSQFNAAPMRSISENSLVAMDFSGRKGKIIEDPDEAYMAAAMEGHLWRKRNCPRLAAMGNSCTAQQANMSTVIHKTQPWFFGRISREESHRIIHQQGLVDGVFLVRDCQSNHRAYVLSLCHDQKIRHFQILPHVDGGHTVFSLDEGHTKFTDLLSLVEFHQLNRGVLPCRLSHPCASVTL